MGGFSKSSYRSRRAKGLRGQGDKLKFKTEVGEGHHMAGIGGRFVKVNRKQARQTLRSRYYENDSDKVGRPFTGKGVKHTQGAPKFTGPLFNPEVSNHERVFRQRLKRSREITQGVTDGKDI